LTIGPSLSFFAPMETPPVISYFFGRKAFFGAAISPFCLERFKG